MTKKPSAMGLETLLETLLFHFSIALALNAANFLSATSGRGLLNNLVLVIE